MTIICLEGASAVGKTSTALALEANYNAYVVPETAFLFSRPRDLTSPEDELQWFLECNLKRWSIAVEKARTHELVVMDGDHIKLWYDWVYGDKSNYEISREFYREHIQRGVIGFPDAYFILHTSHEELKARKLNDVTRRRRNFEKHLRLVEPQKRLFLALNEFVPGYVKLVEARSIKEIVAIIVNSLGSLPKIKHDGIELFNYMTNWMETHDPR